jgi:hypothetical protein
MKMEGRLYLLDRAIDGARSYNPEGQHFVLTDSANEVKDPCLVLQEYAPKDETPIAVTPFLVATEHYNGRRIPQRDLSVKPSGESLPPGTSVHLAYLLKPFKTNDVANDITLAQVVSVTPIDLTAAQQLLTQNEAATREYRARIAAIKEEIDAQKNILDEQARQRIGELRAPRSLDEQLAALARRTSH